MNNTLRQVAAALSTSILVTIMTTAHADMLIGAQITYKIITGIALIGLVLSFMYPKATEIDKKKNGHMPILFWFIINRTIYF